MLHSDIIIVQNNCSFLADLLNYYCLFITLATCLMTINIYIFVSSCPTCMKNYVNRQNLKRHIKIHHSSSTSFSCDICRTFFKKKNQLKAHIYQHTGIKSFRLVFTVID